MAFGTKAEMLQQLRSRLTLAQVCDLSHFRVSEWRSGAALLVSEVLRRFPEGRLIVRSSASAEDTTTESLAGRYRSVQDVDLDARAITEAVEQVIASYDGEDEGDQILIQPMVTDVAIAGVVTTRDLATGAPYYVINYDDVSGRTDQVTAGLADKCIQVRRSATPSLQSPRMRKLLDAVMEVERLTGCSDVDIEFCVDRHETVFILQARPIARSPARVDIADALVDDALDAVRSAVGGLMTPRPGLAGATTVLTQMSDWNPAEMIGGSPKPLALSLYRFLITDGIWADARAGMGYRRVQAPLMVSLHGRPFIDVRCSLNSFLPADVAAPIADALVDAQVARLAHARELHDRIEFDVAVTCRDLAFDLRAGELTRMLGSTAAQEFHGALHALTARALGLGRVGLEALAAKTDGLARIRTARGDAEPSLPAVHLLLERCRREGTLPFAVLARHAFIASAFLRSLVERGVLTNESREALHAGIRTVAGQFVDDMHGVTTGQVSQEAFLDQYGHLRPGTYDITSWRYDERPDLYIGPSSAPAAPLQLGGLTRAQEDASNRLLAEAGFALGVDGLLDYAAAAITLREQTKFNFTRALSAALSQLTAWGFRRDLSREDLAFLTLEDLADDRVSTPRLREQIAAARQRYAVSRVLSLPSVITRTLDVDVVRLPIESPTFITHASVTAPTLRLLPNEAPDVDGHVMLIEAADPGYDWVFSHRPAGLITMYGGVNSHMAIRAAEFGLPAAIGCGRRRFEALKRSPVVTLDCGERAIRLLG
jgi:phosphohistidine swiveling domain-containing protein